MCTREHYQSCSNFHLRLKILMFERKSWLFCNLKMISKINGDLIWTFWTLHLIWGSHYFLARDKIVEKSWINFLCQSWLQRIATRIDKLQERLVKIHECCLWDIITPCCYYCLDGKKSSSISCLEEFGRRLLSFSSVLHWYTGGWTDLYPSS